MSECSDSSVVRSSVRPFANSDPSRSSPRLVNGSTTTDIRGAGWAISNRREGQLAAMRTAARRPIAPATRPRLRHQSHLRCDGGMAGVVVLFDGVGVFGSVKSAAAPLLGERRDAGGGQGSTRVTRATKR